MIARLASLAGAMAFVAVMLGETPVAAHSLEKTIDLVARADGLEVAVGYGVPAGAEARMLREHHDADHDGRLTPAERASLGDALARRILAHVRFSARGRPLELGNVGVDVDAGGGFDTAIPVRLRAELTLAVGERWDQVTNLTLAVGGGRDGFVVRVTRAAGGLELAPAQAQVVPGTPTVFTVTKAKAPSRRTAPARRAR